MIKVIDNYSGDHYWFRRYSDGLIEQGGIVYQTSFESDSTYIHIFPVSFQSAPLSVIITFISPRVSESSGDEVGLKYGEITSSKVTLLNDGKGTNKIGYCWEAKGY